MIEQSVDVTQGRTPVPAVAEAGSMTHRRAQAFCYCAECGSWDAHGLECLCCGYDFHYDPQAPIPTAA